MLLLIFPTCQKMWYYIDIFFRLAVWSIVVMCPWIKPRYCIVESHLFAKQAQRVSRLWQCHLRLSTAFVSVPTDCQSMDLICLLVEGIWQSLPVAAQGMRLYWVWFLVRPRAVPCGDPPYSIMAGNIMWVILIDELDSHQFVIISKYCIVFFDSLFLSISVFPHWLDNCCTFPIWFDSYGAPVWLAWPTFDMINRMLNTAVTFSVVWQNKQRSVMSPTL